VTLAFLAPSLIEAAVEGRLPHGIGVARLSSAPGRIPPRRLQRASVFCE
jgi:hypothetical protein